MITLAALAWLLRIVIIAGGAVVLALALAHIAWRRRRAVAALARIEELARSGYAGFDVVPFEGEPSPVEVEGERPTVFPGRGLALVTRLPAPEGCTLLLDSRPDAPFPEELPSVVLWRSSFAMGVGSELAKRGLAANAAALRAAGDILAAWRSRLTEIRVSTDRVLFLFEMHQLPVLERALPALARFAAAVLSAIRWYPPRWSQAAGGGPFRGAGADAAAEWFLESGAGREGPLRLEQVLARMQEGRASWLTRAACGRDGPLLPVARQDALATARVPITEEGGGAATGPLDGGRPSRRAFEGWVLPALIWPAMVIASLFAEPNLRRAALGQASTSWPSTSGKVLSSLVVSQKDSDDKLRYRAAVSYEYEVGGVRRIGDCILFYYRWGFDGYSYDQSWVEGMVQRYPMGRSVPVYYDPQAPAVSVLEPGMVTSELVSGAVALGVIGLGTLMLLLVGMGRARVSWLRRRVARG